MIVTCEGREERAGVPLPESRPARSQTGKEISLGLVVKHKKISKKISKLLKAHLQAGYSAPGRHEIFVARLLQVWRARRVVGHLKIHSLIFSINMTLFNLIRVCNL